MSQDELEMKKRKLVSVQYNVKTKDECMRYMMEIQPLLEWEDSLPMKIMIFPDYED